MSLLNFFKRNGIIAGQVTIHGLPPHEFFSASVAFFPVASASSPPPFGGVPPADQYTDEARIKENEAPEDQPLRFQFERSAGFYYLDVGVIAFFRRDGKMFAQVERFFPLPAPVHLKPGSTRQVDLTVTWPDIPFEELGYYGTVYPQKKSP
jgi:hypothetical protein